MKSTLDDWLEEISELSEARKKFDIIDSNKERDKIAEQIGHHLNKLSKLLDDL